MELKGKVAIVTGASLGIGSAIALDLADNGADVVVNYRSHKEEAQEVAASISAKGVRSLVVQADVSQPEQANQMVDAALRELGRLDILVNNAGVNRDAVLWKMTDDQWDTVIDTNLKGCFNFIRAVAPIFREQGSGRIVNIISINGLRGKFGQSNYSASKAGVIGLTKTAARELGRNGITVNAVAPGLITTPMMLAAPESVREMALAESVLQRLGTPEDVAHLVTFLCSDKAMHITGEVIKVDGGQYI